jgi:two-component system, LytTR family, sensor histidine kinase AlgZ
VQIPQGSIVRATWAALLHPKRLIPILVVCIPMVLIQAKFSRDGRAVPLAVLLCLAFVLLSPVSYRVLFPAGLEWSHGAVRMVLYGLVGVGVVLSIAAGLPKMLSMSPTFLGDRTTMVVCAALFLVGGWGLGRDIHFESHVEKLEQQAQHARLLALKNHLDPHFLFNTLNALAEWCRIDGAVAEKALLQLSEMMRTILEGVQTPQWPLEKEVELVRKLFALHQMRDQEKWHLKEVFDSPLPRVQVPAMAVLSLAENALKHGPGRGHFGAIVFEIKTMSQCVSICIENPGSQGAPRASSQGIAMLNTQLQQLGLPKAQMNSDGQRTRAWLEIPT